MNQNFKVKSHIREYDVLFKDSFDFLIPLKHKDAFWVIDKNVFNLYHKYFSDIDSSSLFVFDPSEEGKTIDGAIEVYRALLAKSIKRRTRLISVGGGITQDVTGFVTSTFFRGLVWIYIPTTLLAQADSCIGSKSSLNFDSYKNLIGTFYPPKAVFLTTKFLPTLSKKDWYSGFGEIVKLQLMQAKKIKDLKSLEKKFSDVFKGNNDTLLELIVNGLHLKKKYIEKDEFDTAERKFLNYGHGFGHAFESVSHFAVPHGLSVIIGIIFAYIIAKKRKYVNEDVFEAVIYNILVPSFHKETLNLNDSFFDPEALFAAMKRDKKRTGKGMALIVPKSNFKLEIIQDLSYDEIVFGISEVKKIIL